MTTATTSQFTIPRRLLSGGNPDAPIDVPEEDAFIQWLDERGEPLDWDASLAEEGEAQPTKRILEFVPAERLERMGLALIRDCEEFKSVSGFRFAFRWKRAGGPASGIMRPRGLLADVLRADFLVWLNAEIWQMPLLGVTAFDVETELYGRLILADASKGRPKIRQPQLAICYRQAERYGAYCGELRQLVQALQNSQQLTLVMPNGAH